MRRTFHLLARGVCNGNLARILAFIALFLAGPLAAVAQTQVGDGGGIYRLDNGHAGPITLYPAEQKCASCHFVNGPSDANPLLSGARGVGSNHIAGANNLQRILDAFGTGGVMTGYLGTPALDPTDGDVKSRAFKLALYIGQYKAPKFKDAASGACTNPTLAMKARSGAPSVQDIYPCLVDDGDGGAAQDIGGLSIRNQVNAPNVTASQLAGAATVAYNIGYTSAAGFTGTAGSAATFDVAVINPAAAGGVIKRVSVDVYGVTSGANATGAVGRIYNAGAPLYTIQSNDPLATFSATLVSPAAALGTLGLNLDGNGRVVGTLSGTPGTYTMRVQANIKAATVGAANAGAVTKDVTLVVGGITSAAVANYTQDQEITTYQITSNIAMNDDGYDLSPIPPGLLFSKKNGRLTGTPTFQGTTNATISATTAAGEISQALQINIASAGPPVLSSNLPASPAVTGKVNSSVNGKLYSLSANRPPLGNYVVVSGSLPTDLMLAADTGAITGTPSVSGDFPVSFRTSNASGNSQLLTMTLRISPIVVPTISSANAVSANVNQLFAGYQIVANNLPILSYAVVAPSTLPPGLELKASGLIDGTPNASGTFTTRLIATNAAGNSAQYAVTFTIVPNTKPTVTVPLKAAPLVTGTVDAAITPIQIAATNATITAYGADGLPNGLSVNADGKIVGTPLESGDFDVVARATNVAGTGFATSVKIRISPKTVPTISSANAVSVNAGQPFAGYQIVASNLPILNYSVVAPSTLPSGLRLNSSGLIDGTPDSSGTFTTRLIATNAAGNSAPYTVTFTVVPNTLPTVTVPLPAAPLVTGTVGSAITPIQIAATNPAITAYAATGLPDGLSVKNTGQIFGTPTQSGDFTVVAQATNATGTGFATAVTIRISPNTVPTINSVGNVNLNINAASGTVYQITATNPTVTSYAVVAPSALPAGLLLNTVTGAITGSPTTSGNFSTTLSATNAAGTSAPFVLGLSIKPDALPVVSAPLKASPLVTGTVGAAITPIQIAATNAAITAYGADGLPGGLVVNAAGQIVGTPTQSGDFSVRVSATNIVGTGNSAARITIRISPNTLPVISSANAVSTNVNQPFAGYQVVASNGPILRYSVLAPSTLPAGLLLNASSGLINGTPVSSGEFATRLVATNAAGRSAAFTVTFIVVADNRPTVTAPLLAAPQVTGTVGSAISPIQIAATNPVITSYGADGLPNGLSVNSSGQIVGTPTQSGDFAVTVRATNIVGTGTSAAPVTIRINPNATPVIASAASATATVNTVFAGYQIVASNGPITAYSVVAPSQLPAGLSLSGTGAISGTPTVSGSFSVLLSATNVSGAGAPFTLTLSVNPSSVPTITSPTFASLPAGVAITPIQVVASNPVVLEYLATGLPPGLTVNAVAGTITGTPTTPGNYSANISARNLVGTGILVVPFTVGVPTPIACTMSVPLNTATTLDLASCLFAGFAPTGVTVVATPAHGTAVVSGTRVTYTPVNNYFGADSFTFVGSGTGGISPQGTVTVTVTGRPDPVQDPVVGALLAAQNDTAQRFSRAQISNFQRRMESLHRSAGEPGAVASGLQGRIDTPAAVGFGGVALASSGVSSPSTTAVPAPAAASDWLAGRNNATTPPAGAITSLQANQTPVAARESDVVRALAAGLGVQSLPLAESVISLVRDRSVNLSGVATGLGLNGKPGTGTDGSTSYWIEGVATFGTRDARGGFSSSEFSSDGITVGADKRYSDQLALGMGLGYARDKTLIGTDGSVNRTKGYSLAVYGSYQPTPTTFVDGLLGIGSLDFDTTRFVAPISDFAYGKRAGSQVFGSLTGGYEFRNGNLLLSPYGRVDFSTDRLKDSTETGAAAFALRYARQTSTSIQGSLGLRAESIHTANFGYVVPRGRVEYRHEFKGAGDAYIQYADQLGGPLFRLASAGGPRDSVMLGLGSDFILRDGLTLSLEYQLSHSFASASTHALRLRLSKDFDVRGLPRLMSYDAESAHDEPMNVQVEAGAVYDDNVTRAKAGPDRVGDHLYSVNVGKAIRQPLSANSQLLWIGNIGGEKFRRFNGLSRASISGEMEYQYRASSEFDEPTFGAFARLSGDAFESELRDGYRLSAGVSVRQSLTDRINVFAALSHNVRKASSQVFSTRDNAIRGNIDYALNDKDILYMGAEYRRGDIVSTGRPSLENVTVAEVFAQDDAYPGGQMFSYRFRGSTSLLTVGYNMGLGPRDSIDFSWRHIRSTPGLRPSFVTSPRNYTANQLSLVYLMRF